MNTVNLKIKKEGLQDQRAISIWFTGLSGSGKSTLAEAFEKKLTTLGAYSKIIDGDQVRKGLNNDLGFTESDRLENIRRVAEVSKLFSETGITTLCSFICPLENMRELAKNIIGKNYFILVFLNASFEACENRDIKGLYAKARKGEIKNFTGLTATYEIPENADLTIDTVNLNIETCIEKLIEFVIPKILSSE